MYKINFNIINDIIISKFEHKELPTFIFSSDFELNKNLKESYNKCRKLIQDNPQFIINNHNEYDPEILKTIAQAIIITARYLLKINYKCFKYDDPRRSCEPVKRSILAAIFILEIMQINHGYIGFYDKDSSDKWVLVPLENLGMYLNPYRLANSLIICEMHYNHSSRNSINSNNFSHYLNMIQQVIYKVIDHNDEQNEHIMGRNKTALRA